MNLSGVFSKSGFVTLLCSCFLLLSFAQDKSKFNLKDRGLKLRENLGKQVLKVMTSKTDDLSKIKVIAYYVSGVYPTSTEASGMDFYPDDLKEGDHILGLNLMKNEGVGVYQLDGEITYNGQPLERLGGGGYLLEIDPNDHSPKTIVMKSSSGQTASFTVTYVPEVDIEKVNGEKSLPVIDVTEDLTFEYSPMFDDDLSEIRLAFLTDAAGARAWNYFETIKEREGEIRIPKESLATTEISSSAPGGVKFLQGNNYLLVERKRYKDTNEIGDIGPLADLRIESISYKAMPVIVKGKAKTKNGNFIMMREGHIFDRGEMEIEMSKPNVEFGIPLSMGSKFGVSALSISGSKLDKVSRASSRYVSLISKSKMLSPVPDGTNFPEIPKEHLQGFLDMFYDAFQVAMKKEFFVEFEDVNKITSSNFYSALPTESFPSSSLVNYTYKSTKRVQPTKLADVFNSDAAKESEEKPDLNLMNQQDIDGLVNIEINFKLAQNQQGELVLIPEAIISINGRDENGAKKEVVYGTVAARAFHGVPLDLDKLRTGPEELYRFLRGDELIYGLKFGLIRIQQKERELGFEQIWGVK